jgi:uncharacterized protein (TIGR03067 family)
MSPLNGLWQLTRAEFAGDIAPELVTAKTVLELSTRHYAIRFDGEIMDEGTFTITETADHSKLVLIGERGTNTGRKVPAIYQCVGDRLRICFGFAGIAPTRFGTSADSEFYLASYRRISR